ncbi:MAG TPA: DUF1844 domain-containing protein [Candidatus Binataceae bacterium]|nr:DUF1844 domain-containing protein [Candidatus Binataceae bacterium]
MRDEEEKDKGFKVQDRRRFSAEGEAKPGPEQAETAAGSQTGAAGAAQAAGSAPQPHAAMQADDAEPEINFVTFLVGLSTEALAALGEMPDPATGKPSRDLRAARHLIDIIAMLSEKTRGNLDPNEQSLIEAILFDLRMKYVELARSPAR